MKAFPRLIGVIHLPALPGSPGAGDLGPAQALQKALGLAVAEAKALTQAGFDGLILENFGDIPFLKGRVSAETVAALSVIAAAVREVTPVTLGINVLRNDALSALAIAAVTDAQFVRVNVLSGVAATDQGIIEGVAAELLRERGRLRAKIQVFADVHVKHAKSLSSDDIALAVEEAALRAGADAVIVTGETTGRPVSIPTLERASHAAKQARVPLYIGSGSTPENIKELSPWVYGVIVGSSLRRGGKAGEKLDQRRIKEFVQVFNQ